MGLAHQLELALQDHKKVLVKAKKLKSRHPTLKLKVMKKITFLGLLCMLLLESTLMAQVENRRGGFNQGFNANDPIVFVERGIEFYVFLDGTFDFNTRPFDSQGGVFFRRGQANNGTNFGNYGVVINTDSFGRIRRVGNVFINYDRFDRVSRVGSVFMNYNRIGLLSRVGGLAINYNRAGHLVGFVGHVNGQQFVRQHTYYGSTAGIVNGPSSGLFFRPTE